MANTKVTKGILADDSVGIDQLHIENSFSSGMSLSYEPTSGNLRWANTGVAGISSSADATAITIDSSERVLIGTDSGDSFNADSMLRLQRAGDRVFMQFKTDADQNSGILFGDVDDDVECAIEYEPANQALAFSTGNNNEAFKIQSTGYAEFAGASDVRVTFGSAGTAGTNNANWVRGESNYLAFNSAGSGFKYEVSGSEKMRLDSAGKLGIGTGSSDPDTQLHVKNTSGIELRLEADSNNSGQEDCFIRFYTDGKTQEGIVGMDNNNSSTLFSGNTENAMVFGTVSNLPIVLATNNTERWIVEAGGKFYGTGTIQANTILMGGSTLSYGGASYGYIGTNSTAARFGYFRDSSNNYPAMIFNTGDDCHFSPHDSGVQVYFGSQGGDFGGNSSHNVRAASNLFMFNAGGSSGQFVFEVNGHGMLNLYGESSTAVVINGHNSTGGSVNWIPHSSKGSNESHAHYGNNGDWYIRPASNSGTVYVKNYQAESDQRLKENIEDMTYGTDEILQLQPRKFNWIDNSEEQNGFIAQEVESVLPNFVATGDMKIDGHEEEEGIKSVNYNSIVATLVKSVQELEARIAELENG